MFLTPITLAPGYEVTNDGDIVWKLLRSIFKIVSCEVKMAAIQNKNGTADSSASTKPTATAESSKTGGEKDKKTLLAVLQFLKSKNLTVRLTFKRIQLQEHIK